MKLSGMRVGAVAVAALCAAAPALAQDAPPVKPRPKEEAPPPPVPPRPIEEPPPPGAPPRGPESTQPRLVIDPSAPDFLGFALGDVSEQQIVGDERMMAATGTVSQPVWIRLPGFELRCDSVVAWGDGGFIDTLQKHRETLKGADPDKILGPLLHAVYAEGAVYAKTNGKTVRADRLFLDFVRGKAYFVRAQMTSEMEGREGRKGGAPIPFTVRADVIRATARDKYRAEGAQVTTCSFADPHYEFATDSVDVDYAHGYGSFETSWWPTVRVDTVVADDTPIFVFPKLGGSSGLASTPLQTVGFSHGNRYGNTLETTWGGDLLREDGSRWGDWKLHVDGRSARGPGAGVDVSHKSAPSTAGGRRDEFEFSSYWQRDGQDRDTFSERAFDGGNDPSTNRNDRGFAHLFDRWHVENPSITDLIGAGWRVDTEVSYYSDRGYFPEYDRSKSETEKQQETYVEARKTWGNQGVSLLASYRLNDAAAALDRRPSDLVFTDYENQTQYMPSATYHLINQPVVGADATGLFPVNLSLQASAASVKRRYDDRLADRIDDGLGWHGEWVRRGDVETRVTTPFSIGDVHVNPAFGGSIYGVDEANGFSDTGGGSEGRYAAFWDVRADTQAWRTWSDASNAFFDLNGLRHVASLDAQVFERFKVSDDASTFQPNDPVDELSESRIASLRLRNRLQTKRDGELVDWLDYEARFLYFIRPTAPNGPSPFGVREDFASPLQNLDFPGEEKYASTDRDGSAYWQHRARYQALRDVWLVGEADYDMQRGAMETSAVGVRWLADKLASLYVGRRTIHSDSTVWTERLDYRLSNKWGIAAEFQQDTKASNRLHTLASLFRRAHDFTIALEFNVDNQANDNSVWFAIYPNDWAQGRKDPFSARRPLDYAALKWYR